MKVTLNSSILVKKNLNEHSLVESALLTLFFRIISEAYFSELGKMCKYLISEWKLQVMIQLGRSRR